MFQICLLVKCTFELVKCSYFEDECYMTMREQATSRAVNYIHDPWCPDIWTITFTAQSTPTCETRLFLLTLRCCCCCLGLGCCCLFLCHLLLVVEALGCHFLDGLQHANTAGKQKSMFGIRRLLKALRKASSSNKHSSIALHNSGRRIAPQITLPNNTTCVTH